MSEVRALLLTDVVDSTKLSEKIGDAAMAEVWAAHDRAARDLLPAWRGREIDKTDGMLMLFDGAADAVGYALAYHRALAALPTPLKARAGLHVGAVILRENSAEDVARGAKPLEVDGLAKPTAARVMSVAAGGQTLLTPEARDDLGKTALKLASHGHWQMKGVSEPIELFEVGEPEARFRAPPDSDKVFRVVRVDDWWMPAKDIPNNLPLQPSTFVGREKELDDIKAALSTSRLVTLLGMGGLGKTRLSLQVASELMHQYTDGAWFIDLSPIRDAELVASEAAHVLGVTEEPGRPLLQTLCAHLKQRRALLVLDNCEHLIAPAAELANAIVRAAPNVRLISSSREPLRVPGERTYPILPLPVPRRGDSVETLLQSTAVRLFVDRAQAHKPSFAVTEKEAGPVAELVARLEGIPLALELAAARVRSMSVLDINARLKHRYKLLTGGGRVLQERQQTLRALVDWSYDLLGDNEKHVLDRLAVFVGGFDLAAAEAVCGVDPVDQFEVLDLVGSLVEKSLVMLEEREEASRYRMLETIREYAMEKLVGRGEESDTAARHCEHYFAFAKEAREGITGAEQGQWVARVETDLDNLRAATSLALAGGVDPFVAVKLAVALNGFWMLRGRATEGREVVRASLALPAVQESDMAQAWALYVGATLATSQSDHIQAREMLERCLELRLRLGKEIEIAATLSTLAMSRFQAGDAHGAVAGEQEALQLFRKIGNRRGEAIGFLHLGQFALWRGEADVARDHLEQGLKIAREIGQREIEAECELQLGEHGFEAGELADARRRIDRSLDICREAADRHGEAKAVWWMGRIALRGGDFLAARANFAEALRAFQSSEMREELLACLEDLVELLCAEGRKEDAGSLAAMAEATRERMALERSPRAMQRWLVLTDELKGQLPPADVEPAWSEGRNWNTEDAVRCALTQPG
jgi:predicted ATPase/class 3 adenylate cyclase